MSLIQARDSNINLSIPRPDRRRIDDLNLTVETTETIETTTATNDQSLFDIDPEMSSMLDDMPNEELRLFADVQEPGGDDETELYIYTCFLAFKKTGSKEHLKRAILQAERWVAVTPDGHAQRARRLELLAIMSARKH